MSRWWVVSVSFNSNQDDIVFKENKIVLYIYNYDDNGIIYNWNEEIIIIILIAL